MRSVLLLVLLLGGCAETSELERDTEAPLQTDRLAYVAQDQGRGEGSVNHYTFDIVAQFTNPTADTVYIRRYRPLYPTPGYTVWSVGEGRREISAYNGIVQLDAPPIAVAPGGVRVDTLRMWGPAIWDGVTGEYDGELAGRMQVEYEVEGCGPTCPWDGGRLVSNPFEVRLR